MMVCPNKNTSFPLSRHHGSVYEEDFGREDSTCVRMEIGIPGMTGVGSLTRVPR